jgi:hypothetical protein
MARVRWGVASFGIALMLAVPLGAWATGSPPSLSSAPVVSGDTTDTGNTLSVSDGTWTGSPTSFSYQWEDCDANGVGSSCADIGGATANTYLLQSSDLVHTIRVKVTAANANGGTTWEVQVPYAVGTPRIVGDSPQISGDTAAIGNEMIVSDGVWAGKGTITLTYQWFRRSGFNLATTIDGATTNSYTTVSDDLGQNLYAEVTATNAYGNLGVFAISALIGAPVSTAAPQITGDTGDAGNVLTVGDGTWAGSPASFAYQWQRCDANGQNCADIGGATADTYTIQLADLGHDLVAEVTATGPGGSATATATVSVADPRPVPQALPFLSGDVSTAGNVLTVSNGTWTNSPTSFSYQWQRCDANGQNCADIDGATASTYTIQAGDLGQTLGATVTATNTHGSRSAASDVSLIGGPLELSVPAISGDTSAAGNVLTVSAGTWEGSPTITYQWQRCDEPQLFCSDIGGAASSTYTIQAADLGHVLQATVTATNAYGVGGDVTSTAPIAVPKVVFGEGPRITGDTDAVGNVLTVSDGTWTNSPTFSYQWQRCDVAGANCSDIAGATADTHAIQPDDLGHELRAEVTATGAGGSGQATAPVTAVVGLPKVVDPPEVSGDTSAVGNVLTVSDGTWSGSPALTYQWNRCDAAQTNCSDIAGATDSTYTLQTADLGHLVDATVTAANVAGSTPVQALTFTPVGAPAVVGLGFPEIAGDTSAAGNVLTASTGTWSGSPTFSYQWQLCDANGVTCSLIDGATANTYTILPGDLGHRLEADVTAANAYGSESADARTGILGAPAVVGFGFPQVSGDTSAAGNLLTVSTGTWSGSPTFSYQWQRCDANDDNCSDIDGATSSTYMIQTGDLGHVLDAVVTATNASAVTSWPARTFVLGTPAIVGFQFPEIGGDMSDVGGVLTVDPGTWSGSPTFSYQWKQCDANGIVCSDIPGATSSAYAIQAGDAGHVLSVDVTATNAYGHATASASTFGVVGLPEIVGFDFPQISGDESAAGDVLTVSTGTWAGSPTFTYQWERCDASGANCADIDGATDTTYTLQTADLGHIIDATVTGTNGSGSTPAPAFTFTPAGAPTVVDFGFPSIAGSAEAVGNVLTVSNGTWSGSPTFTYQWSRCNTNGFDCDDIGGATSSSYTVVSADVGHVLEAVVTATNAYGSGSSSAETNAVGVPHIVGFDFPEISGDETAAGNVLTVNSGTWSGSPTITYQWSRCDTVFNCTAIDGATSSAYTTQVADLGHLLTATVTATNAAGSAFEPALTEWEIGAPELVGAYPSIGGDAGSEGNVLTARTGSWSGSPTFTYQWSRCNTDGFTCSDIDGATGAQYAIQNADLGHFLEVTVTATNANGASFRTAETSFAVGAPELVGAFPKITGNPTAVGNTISVTSGTWIGATSITYQWYRCTADDDNCTPLTGKTSNSYTIVSADRGQALDAWVTATNANGSTIEVAGALVGAPFNVTLPAITGDVSAVGKVLTTTNGTWFGSPTFTRKWFRCDSGGFNCNEIAGATGSTYTLAPADVGHTLFVDVAAHNAVGTTFADSLDTAPVGNGATQHLLTVSVNGSGTVTSSPDGIDCGDSCSAEFSDGTAVVLTPTPAPGATFSGWSGGGCSGTGGCSIALSANTTVTAGFTPTPSAPTITGFSPDGGGPHATVTLTGTNLTYTKSVKLHGEAVPFTVVSATTITFTVPADAVTGSISVTTTSGTATSAGTFTVDAPPTIASLDLTSGPVGTVVTITGMHLAHVVGVKIGHILVVPTSASDTQVTFAIPAGATSGTIEVISLAGTATSADTFAVTG